MLRFLRLRQNKSNLAVGQSSGLVDLPDLLNRLTLLKVGNQPKRARDPICRLAIFVNLLDADGLNQPLLATEPICYKNSFLYAIVA